MGGWGGGIRYIFINSTDERQNIFKLRTEVI